MNSQLNSQIAQARRAEMLQAAADHRSAARLERPPLFARLRAALPAMPTRTPRSQGPVVAPASSEH